MLSDRVKLQCADRVEHAQRLLLLAMQYLTLRQQQVTSRQQQATSRQQPQQSTSRQLQLATSRQQQQSTSRQQQQATSRQQQQSTSRQQQVTSRQRRFFIPRLVNIMTEMRTLTELHREWEETLNMDWSREFQIPPLLYEIASV